MAVLAMRQPPVNFKGREGMKLDWPNLLVGTLLGAIVGFFIGLFAHWAFVAIEERRARQKLKKAYGHLAGDYVNVRIKDDGKSEPTGGTIRLAWLPEGLFKAQGLHSSGVAEWESIIRMNLESDTGTGWYKYRDSHDHGIQQVTCFKEIALFSVLTTVTSRANTDSFIHLWKRKE